MRSNPTLTVVVITRDDPEGLDATLASLKPLKQDAGNLLEILVQDGASQPPVDSVLDRYRSLIDGWTSEVDGGIYDAMNRATARGHGDCVWYLNGGDRSCVASWEALARILEDCGDMHLFGYILVSEDGTTQRRRGARRASYLRHALPTSHQAIIYPGAVVRALQYDTKFQIVADYEMTVRVWQAGIGIRRHSLTLASFSVGGISSSRSSEIAIEAGKVHSKHFGAGMIRRQSSRVRFAISRCIRQRRFAK
jgi:putative colanic acid biosynthesis glycosyltransferase